MMSRRAFATAEHRTTMARGRQRKKKQQQAERATYHAQARESEGRSTKAMEIQLEERAVANGWVNPCTPEALARVVSRQIEIATTCPDPKHATRAAAVVTKIVDQVMRQEDRDAQRGQYAPDKGSGVNVTTQVNVGLTPQQLLDEVSANADFLALARSRLDAGHSGHLGVSCEPGEVGVPAASEAAR